RGYVVLQLNSPGSTRITVSVPYVSLDGVSPVMECGVVL
ncbi:hypothetical protein A2U01_0111449, partial [Trifolium medium]|nr:hypothetical protein [Trifolium medium]